MVTESSTDAVGRHKMKKIRPHKHSASHSPPQGQRVRPKSSYQKKCPMCGGDHTRKQTCQAQGKPTSSAKSQTTLLNSVGRFTPCQVHHVIREGSESAVNIGSVTKMEAERDQRYLLT